MIFSRNMKTLVITTVTAIMLLGTLGCTSTVTLGPDANTTDVLGASAGKEGASLTLPFIKGEVTPSSTDAPK